MISLMTRALLPLLFLSGLPAQDTFTLLLTGDAIVNRPFSRLDDPAFRAVLDRVWNADAAFTNLETILHDFESPANAFSGGSYMASPRSIAGELKNAGFDLLSTANNHAFDYGPEGLASTLRALDAASLTHAGAGRNLAWARAPAYFESRRGRVALVACTSTLAPGSNASPQRSDLAGRPGVSPLRFTASVSVTKSTYDELRSVIPAPSGNLMIGTIRFTPLAKPDDKPSVVFTPNAADLDEIAAAVREARRQADWVIVSLHGHESSPTSRDLPPPFHTTFAHRMIESGADVIAIHGPHVIRGIELHQGKPIFYSLANLFFENETMRFVPTEAYDGVANPFTATPSDAYDTRTANGTRSFPAEPANWDSYLAELTFTKSRALTSLRLTPITLGFGLPRTERGRPRLAAPADAKRILDTLERLSTPYGTRLTRDGDSALLRP